uniref:Uncharacterized protein n=1 Tax=Populus alba TaxID=43335 RepID=A0A4U5PSN8_POPAL|nr:hypothetical protein D5086_0000192730 [Populus alba]
MEMDPDDSASEASDFLSCISRFFMSKARCVVPSDSEDTNNPLSSDSISFESPPRLVDLAVSFQVFLDLTEMEMIKAKKASRLEAEKRRMELEAELTRMMLQTQLQIASIVAGKGTIEESCEAGIDVIQSIVVASRIRTPNNAATLYGLFDQLNLKEHHIEHMLMNLRINPDCLNGRRSWMKNMGAGNVGSDKSVQESIDDKDVESLAATSTVNTSDGQVNHNSRPLVGRSRILTHHEVLETLEVLPRTVSDAELLGGCYTVNEGTKGLLVEGALKEPGLLKQHRTTATY